MMKRMISLILAAVFVLCVMVVSASAKIPYVPGDADCDGTLAIVDATAIQRHLASLKKLTDTEQLAADSDRDDKLTVIDATLIQRYLASLPSSASKVGQYR